MNINIQVSLQYSIFNSFRYNPRSGTAGWYSNSTFNFVRNHHTVSHSSCIISHLGLLFFKEEFITSDIRRTPRTPELPLPPDQIKALSFHLSFAGKEAAVLRYKPKLQWGLQKDIRSSSPARAPKSQLTVKQPSTAGCCNPPKRIIYVQRQRRSCTKMEGEDAIMIKPNPISNGWVNHRLENNNTKKVLALLWRFWIPCQASQPGDLTKGLGIPRESGFEGQEDLL